MPRGVTSIDKKDTAKRFPWNEKYDGWLRRLLNRRDPMLSYREIEAIMKCSPDGIKSRVRKLGWGDRNRAAAIQRQRLTGVPMTAEHREAVARENRRRWQDLEFQKATLDRLASAENQAKATAARRRRDALRRGFSIPDEKYDDYRFLRDKHWYTADAAGMALGLVDAAPAGPEAGRRD
ncbi:hypothetical protein [Aureimonas sp. AU12]|uniref:hypothetical protein n=1 Tax=Aureimonas sp. AU12 TaxID=1638161 RepID=UPI000781A274|nr:hypothetical protein [Aureimonas sp. AU12]